MSARPVPRTPPPSPPSRPHPSSTGRLVHTYTRRARQSSRSATCARSQPAIVSQARSNVLASVHGVLAKQGLHPQVTDLFGVGGRHWLSAAPLDAACRLRVNALLRLIDAIEFELTAVAGPLRAALADHPGFRAVQKVVRRRAGSGGDLRRGDWGRQGGPHRRPFGGRRRPSSIVRRHSRGLSRPHAIAPHSSALLCGGRRTSSRQRVPAVEGEADHTNSDEQAHCD